MKPSDSIVFLVFLKPNWQDQAFLLGLILVLAMIAIVLFFAYQKLIANRKKAVYAEPDEPAGLEFESHLLEKEKDILQALKAAPNHTLKQKQLQEQLKFSKAKLSRTLKDLQVRGLVEVVPYGNTNLVKLLEK